MTKQEALEVIKSIIDSVSCMDCKYEDRCFTQSGVCTKLCVRAFKVIKGGDK